MEAQVNNQSTIQSQTDTHATKDNNNQPQHPKEDSTTKWKRRGINTQQYKHTQTRIQQTTTKPTKKTLRNFNKQMKTTTNNRYPTRKTDANTQLTTKNEQQQHKNSSRAWRRWKQENTYATHMYTNMHSTRDTKSNNDNIRTTQQKNEYEDEQTIHNNTIIHKHALNNDNKNQQQL